MIETEKGIVVAAMTALVTMIAIVVVKMIEAVEAGVMRMIVVEAAIKDEMTAGTTAVAEIEEGGAMTEGVSAAEAVVDGDGS